MREIEGAGNPKKKPVKRSSLGRYREGEVTDSLFRENEQRVQGKPSLTEPHYPGGRMEYLGNQLAEFFQEREDKTATLANGTQIDLPYINYRTRIVFPTNQQLHEPQGSVAYNDLSEEEKAAVEIAVDADERQLHRIETFPEYKRLALKRGGEGQVDQLYSVTFRDGASRRMNLYPDQHGFVTSDTEKQLDRPIELAEVVSEGFLVTHYNRDYMAYNVTYRDHEPNFFGPGEEFANAFWIAGTPRLIRSEETYLMQQSEDPFFLEPRYTIVPIQFYKVAHPKHTQNEKS